MLSMGVNFIWIFRTNCSSVVTTKTWLEFAESIVTGSNIPNFKGLLSTNEICLHDREIYKLRMLRFILQRLSPGVNLLVINSKNS